MAAAQAPATTGMHVVGGAEAKIGEIVGILKLLRVVEIASTNGRLDVAKASENFVIEKAADFKGFGEKTWPTAKTMARVYGWNEDGSLMDAVCSLKSPIRRIGLSWPQVSAVGLDPEALAPDGGITFFVVTLSGGGLVYPYLYDKSAEKKGIEIADINNGDVIRAGDGHELIVLDRK